MVLSSIPGLRKASKRATRLLCAAAAGAGAQLLWGTDADGYPPDPALSYATVTPTQYQGGYDEYPFMYVQWDPSEYYPSAGSVIMYFYFEADTSSSTSGGDATPRLCYVASSQPYACYASQTSEDFWPQDVNLQIGDPFDADNTYYAGVQAWDSTGFSGISWIGASYST